MRGALLVAILSVITFIPDLSADTGKENSLSEESEISSLIKERLISAKPLRGETLKTLSILNSHYNLGDYKPVWSVKGTLLPQVHDMIKAIDAVYYEGLLPENYHADLISELVKNTEKEDDQRRLADLDLLLTDAFFSMGFHFLYGVVDPVSMIPRWVNSSSKHFLRAALNDAIGLNHIKDTLWNFLPISANYNKLKGKLVEYLNNKPDKEEVKIPKLLKGEKLTLGDRDKRVPLIKKSLGVETNPNDNLLFDDKLESAVMEFQKKNGLLADGVVGFNTVDNLNLTWEYRLNQIRVNMDRLRALTGIWYEEKNIIVNIPDFTLNVNENGDSVLSMKVITGMKSRPTPLMSKEVSYIIFSPKWFVPDKILLEDKLPLIREDPKFLSKHHMKVYNKEGMDSEIDPESIDWNTVEKGGVPYRVVQGSGGYNALGRVKFIFPNKDDVYMHDTPDKYLFQRTRRTFSSGCIRVEKPVELAQYFLKDYKEWNAEKIKEAMNRASERKVYLDLPVPIHIIYLTAWVDGGGTLNFREDVYERDQTYFKLLSLN